MNSNLRGDKTMERWVIVLIIIGLYLVLALVVGMLAGYKREFFSVEEFAVTHRNMSLFLMWFMMGGAIFSAFAFLGGPGWAFSKGAPALYILAYGSMGLLPWYIIGPKLARLGKKKQLVSLGHFGQSRYNSRALSVIVGIVAIFAFIQYLAVQIKGSAYIFNIMTEGHVSYNFAAILIYSIVIIYVATGGLRAAAWSDVLQSGLMIVVAWGLGLYLPWKLWGGIGPMFQNIAATKPGFLQIGVKGALMSKTAYSTTIIISVLGFILWPHLFSKSFVTTPKRIRQTVVLYPLFTVINLPILLIGFAAVGKILPTAIASADQILPYLITHALSASGFLLGLVGAGALAASMSTADAVTHGAAVEFAQDVYRIFKPKASDKEVVIVMRIAVIIIGLLALCVALYGAAGLVALLLGAYGSIVQFAPLVYGGLYWKKASKQGAIAGLVAGVLVNTYLQVILKINPLDINAGLWGLLVNLVIFIVVSMIFKPSNKADVEAAEETITA
jgi:SSS family solute:Na+ symporter